MVDVNASRDVIDKAVLDMLASATAKEVGWAQVPSLTPTLPYCVLYPMHAYDDAGSWADPAEDHWYTYQVKCVGADARQAAWMSGKVATAFMAKLGSAYAYPITVSGAFVQGRVTDEIGPVIPTGENLYETNDTYKLRIGV